MGGISAVEVRRVDDWHRVGFARLGGPGGVVMGRIMPENQSQPGVLWTEAPCVAIRRIHFSIVKERPVRDTITEYYEAVDQHDWDKLATVLADDVERIGIMSDIEDDISRGKEPYLAFVSEVIGSFHFHRMKIERIFYSEDRRFACAETTETIQQTPDSERLILHCLKTIELDENELILRIDQFRKMSKTPAPTSLTVSAVMRSRAGLGNGAGNEAKDRL